MPGFQPFGGHAFQQVQFAVPIQLQKVCGQANLLAAGPVVRHVADFFDALALRFLLLPPDAERTACIWRKS